jgi:hypothetical protein
MSSNKRTEVGEASPLNNAGILHHMLNILGPGHNLFISAVSKPWRSSYRRVSCMQIAGVTCDQYQEATLYPVSSETTLGSAVFASAGRINLAHECGLALDDEDAECMQRVAGRNADVTTLQVAQELGLELTDEVLIGASIPKLQWLHTEQGCPLPTSLTFYAARCGNIDTLRWLRGHGSAFTATTFQGAAAGAQLHVLQYLRAEGCDWDTSACSTAAKLGHLVVLQWLQKQGCPWDVNEILSDAAESGSIEILLYLKQQGCVFSVATMAHAAWRARLAACQFLLAEQCPCDTDVCAYAAQNGHLETVRFLHESGCPWDPTTICIEAAVSGNLELLQFLKDQGCAFTDLAMNAAAELGHLETLHEIGCPWDAGGICKIAAESGSIELLQYLKQQGCVFDHFVMNTAARCGHTDVCQYLCAEQCPWLPRACAEAAHGGHVDTLRWLHEQGCPWYIQIVCLTAAAADHLPIIQYVLSVEPAVSAAQLTQMLNAAGRYNWLSTAKLLREAGAEWPAKLKYHKHPWNTDALQWARDEGCTSPE